MVMNSLQSPPFRDRTISIARMTHNHIKNKYLYLISEGREVYMHLFYVKEKSPCLHTGIWIK